MKKNNFLLKFFLFLIMLILLHNEIITLFSNISSIFKSDNRMILKEKSYLDKIEYLEKKLVDYEEGYNNLSIYTDQNYILSRLAIRNVYNFYNYIILKTDSLVKKGSAVINEKGLIGIVDSSNMSTAKVNLLTGKISLSVKINDVYGQLRGYDRKNNLLIIRYIDNYKRINIGDEVLTSGLVDIKSDIKIGRVNKIDKKELEQIVYVKPYVDFNNLNYMYCING